MNNNNKNTDSQKLKYMHLMLKGTHKSLKPKGAFPQKGVALWTVCIGIIIVALCLWIFL